MVATQVEDLEAKAGVTLTFGVNDIDATRKQLEAQNVRFDGETITIPDKVRLTTFYDPGGNTLMLYQDLQKK